MFKNNYKRISVLNFSRLLTCVARISDHTKRISLYNQPCLTRPTLLI